MLHPLTTFWKKDLQALCSRRPTSPPSPTHILPAPTPRSTHARPHPPAFALACEATPPRTRSGSPAYARVLSPQYTPASAHAQASSASFSQAPYAHPPPRVCLCSANAHAHQPSSPMRTHACCPTLSAAAHSACPCRFPRQLQDLVQHRARARQTPSVHHSEGQPSRTSSMLVYMPA